MSSLKSLACLLAVSTALSASIAHAGGPAVAASEPAVAATAAPATKSIWSGPWVGLSFGQGSANYDIGLDVDSIDPPAHLLGLNLPDFGAKGSLAGLELGYGRQFKGNWVAGVQIDSTITSITNDAGLMIAANALGDNPQINASYRLKQSSMLTGLARLGYLTSESTLVYGVMGLTHGKFDASYGASIESTPIGQSGYDFAMSGLTVGAGIETKLGQKTSLKLEYRMTNFGSYDMFNQDIGNANLNAAMDTTVQTVRATVVMHF